MDDSDRYRGGELEVFAAALRWKAYLRRQMAPFVGGRVLEVGAGLGGTTRLLARLPHASWLCLEPDADLARRIGGADLPATVTVRSGTLAGLDAAARFDAVLYVDVLEHIADDRAELAAAAAHLAPGGRLVVLAPAHQALFSPIDAAFGHYRRYDAASLRAAAPDGLEPMRLRYLDSAGMLLSLANCWLLRQSMPTSGQIAVWDRLVVPISRLLDPLTGYRLGKSVLAVWRRSPSE